MPLRPPRPGALLVGVALASVLALSACTSQSPAPSESPRSSSASATPTPSAPPTFSADAATPEALAVFDHTVQTLLKATPQPHGRDVIDALVAAGFDKKAMEVTPDDTTIGRAVDSIEFAVVWKKKDCLVGQVGSSSFSSSSSPVLSTGKCLVGTTRAIDW